MYSRLQQIVYKLALSRHVAEGNVERLVSAVTQKAAQALNVERVSVWPLEDNDQKLRCLDLYELSKARHSSGMILERALFAAEVEALLSSKYIDASDPQNDPRTSGYTDGYLIPLGITSMLDVSIRVSGRVLGSLCLEHVATPHDWHPQEISFACQLADQLALALLNKERNEVLQALSVSEERLRLAMEATSDGFWDWDIRTGKVYWSDRCYTMLGYEPQEFPISRARWERMLHPDDKDEALELLREHVEEGQDYFQAEFRLRTKDNGWRWLMGRGKVVARDPDGHRTRMVGTHVDIDARKRDELMREEIERIVRHDLKKPAINAISAARLIREETELDEDLDTALATVESSGRHMIELINTSLDVYRIETGRFEFDPEPLHCGQAVSEVLQELAVTFPDLSARVAVVSTCSPHASGCAAVGSRHLLRTALMNLITNALEASPKGKTVQISLGNDDGCRVVIRNSGAVPQAIRARFFEKYATHGKIGGTGLGTYSARKMIELQGGSLEMRTSDEEDATTLTIRLPGR